MLKQVAFRLAPLAFASVLSACDPGVHVGWKKTFRGQINRLCVEDAVKSVAGKVSLSDYISDGTPFPKGLRVYQIWYEQPANQEDFYVSTGYRIEVAPMPDGSTGYFHQWGKLGTDIPFTERNYVVPVMTKVNAAVAQRCGLSVGNGNPVQGDG